MKTWWKWKYANKSHIQRVCWVLTSFIYFQKLNAKVYKKKIKTKKTHLPANTTSFWIIHMFTSLLKAALKVCPSVHCIHTRNIYTGIPQSIKSNFDRINFRIVWIRWWNKLNWKCQYCHIYSSFGRSIAELFSGVHNQAKTSKYIAWKNLCLIDGLIRYLFFIIRFSKREKFAEQEKLGKIERIVRWGEKRPKSLMKAVTKQLGWLENQFSYISE